MLMGKHQIRQGSQDLKYQPALSNDWLFLASGSQIFLTNKSLLKFTFPWAICIPQKYITEKNSKWNCFICFWEQACRLLVYVMELVSHLTMTHKSVPGHK